MHDSSEHVPFWYRRPMFLNQMIKCLFLWRSQLRRAVPVKPLQAMPRSDFSEDRFHIATCIFLRLHLVEIGAGALIRIQECAYYSSQQESEKPNHRRVVDVSTKMNLGDCQSNCYKLPDDSAHHEGCGCEKQPQLADEGNGVFSALARTRLWRGKEGKDRGCE